MLKIIEKNIIYKFLFSSLKIFTEQSKKNKNPYMDGEGVSHVTKFLLLATNFQ